MALEVICPNASCGARYRVDDSLRGKKERCKQCGTTFTLEEDRPTDQDGVPAVWKPGDVVLGLYEVKEILGEGGMGTVHRVHHRGWNMDLAVKSPRAALLVRPGAAEDFEREAETWVNLGLHPHVVSCFYVRRLGGTPRVVAEYVAGGSLADWVRSRRLYEGGPGQALERMLDIAIQFAWGLHHAHEQGLVHQDVKPANVMMTGDGIAKVTDFGLARARAAAGEQERPVGQSILVSAGGMTPAYCSPEQAARRPLSRKTDVWSWAVSVLEMFTGEVTWPAGQVAGDALEAYLDGGETNPALPAMPPGLAALLRQCLRRPPEGRPAGMQEVAAALREVYQQVTGQPHGRALPEPSELLADGLNNQAVSFFDLGKREEAEQKWEEALRVDPHHPEATYNQGLLHWRSARVTDEQLLGKLREAWSSCRDPAMINHLIGLIHLERNDCEAVLQVLREPASTGPGRAETAAVLAQAHAQLPRSARLLRTFEGHGHPRAVTSVAWNADGNFALSVAEGEAMRLWDASDGRSLRTFEAPSGSVKSAALSGDGRFVLSGSRDGKVRVWEVASGSCLHTFEGHTDEVSSVAWSPDDRFGLSGSADKTVRLWEVASGRCLHTYAGHKDAATSAAWSPDGRFVLSGSRDKTLRLWDVWSGVGLRTLEAHGHPFFSSPVSSVAWSPDGLHALSGSKDCRVRLWEVFNGVCLRTLEAHVSPVTSVAWSPDGRCALSGSEDKTLRLWDPSTGRCLRTLAAKHPVFSVAWSRDARFALAGSAGTLQLWCVSVNDGLAPLVPSAPSSVGGMAYHHLLNRARQAITAGDPAIAACLLQKARQEPGCVRRAEGLEIRRQLSRFLGHRTFVGGWHRRTFKEHTGPVASVAWSPDGRYALSGGEDHTVRLWDASEGVCLRTLREHGGSVRSVAWSLGGLLALSGVWTEGKLRWWDVFPGRCLRTIPTGRCTSSEPREPDGPFALSPDGDFALSGSAGLTVRLWEVGTGRCLRTFGRQAITLSGRLPHGFALAWSPDGRFFLSDEDPTLRLWEVASGRCLRTFAGHVGRVSSVAWSPESRFALSGGADRALRLWDVATGTCSRTLEAHLGPVTSVAWSPDGRFALSGSADQAMRLWDVSSGVCLRTFEGHTGPVTSVGWSPDGGLVLSASADHTLRLWELDWEPQSKQPVDWDEGARPYLTTFLSIHTPSVGTLPDNRQPTEEEVTLALTRRGKPRWAGDHFQRLLDKLSCAGYGWLRPEGVRRELEKMAAAWQGPPPL